MLQDVYQEAREGHAELLCPRNLAGLFEQRLFVRKGCERGRGCTGTRRILRPVCLLTESPGILEESD